MVKRKPRPKRHVTKAPAAPAGYAPGTLGEWLNYLIPDADPNQAPAWPPDVFAIGAAFLRRTGGYVNLVNGCHAKAKVKVFRPDEATQFGLEWREKIEHAFVDAEGRLEWNCPVPVAAAWAAFRRAADKPLAECRDDHNLTAVAVNLCIVADAACVGLGIEFDPGKTFTIIAESIATLSERRSYCWTISPDKIAVLGKQHTPQRGCSIRSLSHNLALYTPTEIHAYWPAPIEPESAALDVFNILLLPWPLEVKDSDFSASAKRHSERVSATADSGAHRYFDYSPVSSDAPPIIARRVAAAMDQAAERIDRLHAVVLPELALDEAQYLAVERKVAERGAMLVSGVRLDPQDDYNGMPANACAIQPLGLTALSSGTKWKDDDYDLMRRWQLKHHRWCLDRRQVIQYQLGGRVPASRDCWERSYIGPRDINFVTLTKWLTICTLICEDLARQEPVAEVVRAVGPNLVFALLMDGPQLRNRWSSRYASVLAEDPGSSILSVTSLGMSKRSEPSTDAPGQPDKRHTVALWRDAVFGEREIAVSPEHSACVLSLVCKTDEEFTIDGRSDQRVAHFPVYAGHFSFAVEQAR